MWDKFDLRDAALKGIKEFLTEEGHEVITAMSEGLGIVYIDGVGPMYIVEIHEAPK